MKKRILAATAGVLAAMGMLTGCGSDASGTTASTAESKTTETASGTTETSAAAASEEAGVSETLQYYRENGFRIGAEFLDPYIYTEGSDDAVVGIDYDILTAVLGELGIEDIKVNWTPYESVILELNNNNVDCTSDGMYITEARMNQGVYFSDVCYYENDCMLIAEDSDITSVEDLKDKVLAICTGSVAADIAEEMLAEGKVARVDYYTSNDLTFNAVSTGQADAVIADCFAVLPALGEDSSLGLKYLDSYEPQLVDAVAGYGFRASEKDFVEEFNAVLNEMKKDGRLQAIFDKWNMSENVFCGVEEGHTENLAQ